MPEAKNSACFLGLLFFIALVPILAEAQGCFCVGVGEDEPIPSTGPNG